MSRAACSIVYALIITDIFPFVRLALRPSVTDVSLPIMDRQSLTLKLAVNGPLNWSFSNNGKAVSARLNSFFSRRNVLIVDARIGVE